MNDLSILLDKKSESFYHKSIKQLILKYVSERNFNIAESSTEKYFKNHRADVYFKLKNGQKIVVEIQQSRISIKEIIKRTREYNQQELFVLWILHGKGKCVASPKFPEHKKNIRINPVEKFLHKMYGGRVYYVNVTNSKSKITAPYALHYSLSDKKTDKLIKCGFEYYYFRNSNFTFIPNWNLLCTNFNNFKIARFYDKNVKNSLKNLILSYIQIYLKENPYDYKKYRKTKKLISNVIKEFKSQYGKLIIIDCIKLINKKILFGKIKIKAMIDMKNKKDNIIQVLKTCPICQSKNHSVIKKVSYPEGILRTSRCNNCSVSFSSTRFTDDYLYNRFYQNGCEETIFSDSGSKMYANYEITHRSFFQNIVKQIKKRKNSGKWLDFGCGKGYLLDIASKYEYECYGVDLRKDFIKNDKIKFFRGNLYEAGFKDKNFEIITMINVLDHLGSPKNFLLKVNSLLKDNGILFLHIPNEHFAENIVFRRLNIFKYTPNYHILNYSEKNIGMILKRFNFSKIEFISPKYYMPIRLRKKILVLTLEIFNKIAIKLNKGIWPSMELIAYK